MQIKTVKKNIIYMKKQKNNFRCENYIKIE